MAEFWIYRDCAAKFLLLIAAKILLLVVIHPAVFQLQRFDEDQAKVMPQTVGNGARAIHLGNVVVQPLQIDLP